MSRSGHLSYESSATARHQTGSTEVLSSPNRGDILSLLELLLHLLGFSLRRAIMARKALMVGALALSLLVTFEGSRTRAEEITVEEALKRFDRSAAAVESFDVYLTISHTLLTKILAADEEAASRKPSSDASTGRELPQIKLRDRKPGEEPTVQKLYLRQTLAANGNRRFEVLTSEGKPEGIAVLDGNLFSQYTPKRLMMSIRPFHGRFTGGFQDVDYLGFFRDAFGGSSLVEIFRMRKSVRLIPNPDKNLSRVVLECPPEPGSNMYPKFGWQVHLDPAHGFLPARTVLFRESMEGPGSSQMDVTSFREIATGVWAPVDVSFTFRRKDGVVTRVTRVCVNVEKSRWNQPLPDDLFILEVPPGTEIINTVGPGTAAVPVAATSQRSPASTVLGRQFRDAAWEYPTGLLPGELPGLTYISGPGDPELYPKAAWRKPFVLRDKAAGVTLSVNCFRERVEEGRSDVPGTPAAPLLEPDYRYASVEFHGLRAASASDGERNVFAFWDRDVLFKIEATGGEFETRRKVARSAADAIWKFRHLK